MAIAVMLAGCVAPQRPRDVVIYASGSDLESANPLVTIHPLSRQIQRFVLFVTLARYDSTLAPAPYYARRWEWKNDRRALVFHLDPALRWHDGVPTTAADVAFTIEAGRDPATGYLRAGDLAAIDSVHVADDSTAIVHFAAAQSSFPLVFCELPIIPRHLLEQIPRRELRRAAFNTAPVGNGPFVFVDRVPNQRWTFRRNPDFPPSLGGPPRLAGLVVAVVDEATTKFAGLASGDLDVAGISPATASLAARDPSLRVVDYPVLFTTGVVFNTHRPPFDDVRVRRAVSLSIDRDRIVRAALAGYGRPANGPVPPENPLALPDEPKHTPHEADSLFDAAGWKRGTDGARRRNGRPLTFELLTVGSGDNAVEQLIQADLAERGVRMEIRQVEMGSFLTIARARDKRFDALITGFPGDLSLAYLGSMFDARQAGSSLDYANFHTRALDTLFAATRRAITPAEARAAWGAVQRALDADLPVAWVYHARGLQGLSARLRNVRMDLRGEMPTVSGWEIAQPPASIARSAAREASTSFGEPRPSPAQHGR